MGNANVSRKTSTVKVEELASDDADNDNNETSPTLNNGQTKSDDKSKSNNAHRSDSKALAEDDKGESNHAVQSDNKSHGEDDKEPVLVIAIDFGTTYTGYAFSFKGSRDEIQTALRGHLLEDDRVPTVVLLNPDQTFNSFGFEAIDTYTEMSAGERKSFFYIEHFKMALYTSRSQRISRTTTIRDNRKRKVNAMKVFTMAIKYFCDLAFHMANGSVLNLENDHIQWILTIPAIWTDSARQFMREAAVGVGIVEDKLRLVLEPEAASLFCQETEIVAAATKLETLSVGHKYILADLGGGTADICVHEILKDGKLRELYRATGGDYGGNSVNEAFIAFIIDLVGEHVWNTFKDKFMKYYFGMMKIFETKKKSFSIKTKGIHFAPEFSLLNLLDKEQSLGTIIQNKPYRDVVSFNEETGHLTIEKEKMESFFNSSVNGIITKFREILQYCGDLDIKSLMLVGGFAESPYVRERITKEIPSLRVILHPDTRLAVLKGAVMMGYMPRNIVQRRAIYTYGFRVLAPFREGTDPETTKCRRDGKDWCKDIFVKMIEKDQKLEYGGKFVHKRHGGTARYPDQKYRVKVTELWRSTRKNPHYCLEEEDCEMVGRIIRVPPPGGWPVYWDSEEHLIVGETEFTVKYINKTTGEQREAKIDFL